MKPAYVSLPPEAAHQLGVTLATILTMRGVDGVQVSRVAQPGSSSYAVALMFSINQDFTMEERAIVEDLTETFASMAGVPRVIEDNPLSGGPFDA